MNVGAVRSLAADMRTLLDECELKDHAIMRGLVERIEDAVASGPYEDTEMLPCPFCGCGATVGTRDGSAACGKTNFISFGRCTVCGAQGPAYHSGGGQKLHRAQEKARQGWNGRAR